MKPAIHDDAWPDYAHHKAQDFGDAGAEEFRKADPLSMAMYATCMANMAIQAINVLAKKTQGELFNKSLDGEAFETMSDLAERLERLESNLQEIADHGFRYRGYWRDDMIAKRGDAFTNDGSMWWALRDTTDKPCNESADWQVAVRKGRDGK